MALTFYLKMLLHLPCLTIVRTCDLSLLADNDNQVAVARGEILLTFLIYKPGVTGRTISRLKRCSIVQLSRAGDPSHQTSSIDVVSTDVSMSPDSVQDRLLRRCASWRTD